MANHEELVAEMIAAEKMSMSDRLKLAKKRRAQQLKAYAQYEKELSKHSSSSSSGRKSKGETKTASKSNRRLQFTGSILLLDAAARNDVTEVRNLLNAGVGPNAANEDGLTALHQCCIDGLEEMMKLLLENGADVDARDSELWTPLHAAATCGHVNLCRQLCDHGANLLAVNADGNMPYDLCEDVTTLDYIESEMAKRGVTQEMIDETRASTENAMMAELQNIINNGGDIEYRGPSGETPLHIASCNGYYGVAEFILSHGGSVDVVDNDEWQPLHCAVCWGQLNIIKVLLEHGADIDAKTRNGESAMDLCEDFELRRGITELLDEIHSNSEDVNLSMNSLQRHNSSARRGSGGVTSHALMRRTSLLEKDAMSTKDKLEEAQRFREMMQLATDENDEDDTVAEDYQAALVVGDVQLSVAGAKESPRPTSPSLAVDTKPTSSSQAVPQQQQQSASPASKSSAPKTKKVTETSANADIFWQPPASASSSPVGKSDTVVNGNGTAEVNKPVDNRQPSAITVTEPSKSSSSSLSDLKKQRAQQRQERLYRRRGSFESDDRSMNSVAQNGAVSQSVPPNANVCSLVSEETRSDRPRRKHSNRYDLVMPEKRNDVCCCLM